MKQVTLYWDTTTSRALFYYSGKRWRIKPSDLRGWRDCINQDWTPNDFDKSLTVNNFKEK